MSQFIASQLRNLKPVKVPANAKGMPGAPFHLTLGGSSNEYVAKNVDHMDDGTLILTLEDDSTMAIKWANYVLTKRVSDDV